MSNKNEAPKGDKTAAETDDKNIKQEKRESNKDKSDNKKDKEDKDILKKMERTIVTTTSFKGTDETLKFAGRSPRNSTPPFGVNNTIHHKGTSKELVGMEGDVNKDFGRSKDWKLPLNLSTMQCKKFDDDPEETRKYSDEVLNEGCGIGDKTYRENKGMKLEARIKKEVGGMNGGMDEEDATTNEDDCSEESTKGNKRSKQDARTANNNMGNSDSEGEVVKRSRLSPVSDASDTESIKGDSKFFRGPQHHVSSNGYMEFYMRLQQQQLEQQQLMNHKDLLFSREALSRRFVDWNTDDDFHKHRFPIQPSHHLPHIPSHPLSLPHAPFDKVSCMLSSY